MSPTYRKWLNEDVHWIITPQERAEFQQISTDQQRDDFIRAFWEKRDPTPGTPKNEFKEEHYRRLAYTNEHFSDSRPGWRTDRGRIYVLYGRPDSIETHGQIPDAASFVKSESSAPYIVWHYVTDSSHEGTFTFVDTCRCGTYKLEDAR